MVQLSKRAQKMLKLVRDPNRWYTLEKYHNSPSMNELVAAGLVERQARAALLVGCYVPTGTKVQINEQYPEDYSIEDLGDAS